MTGGSNDGGSETAAAAGGPQVPDTDPFAGTPEEYWRAIERAKRDRFIECLGSRADYDVWGYTVVPIDFFVELRAESDSTAFRRGLESGRLRFDAEAAGACLAKVRSESCVEFRRDNAIGTRCYWESYIVGTTATGGFCEMSAECERPDDNCQFAALSCYSGKCTPRPRPGEPCALVDCADGARCSDVEPYLCEAAARAKEGERCGSSECEPGLFCPATGICREYSVPLGCTRNADCPAPEVCLFESGEGQGVCGPPRAVGEACGMNPYRDDDCASGAACRESVCTDVWVPLGATCRNTGQNGGLCIESRCEVFDPMTEEGACVPFPTDGEACTGGDCAPGLVCEFQDGCVPLPFCDSESCGAGKYCSGSSCLPEKIAGDACGEARECGFAMACVDGLCIACD
jgi:hypothetical protein